MTRIRYTPEEKENALRLCEAIGVNNASKETGISVNSLYKWRSSAGKETETPDYGASEAPAAVSQAAAKAFEAEGLPPIHARTAANGNANEELVRLRIENDALKAQMAALKGALRVFTE